MMLFVKSKLIKILHSINDLNDCERGCKGGAKGVRLDAPIIMVLSIQHMKNNNDVFSKQKYMNWRAERPVLLRFLMLDLISFFSSSGY